MVVCDVPGVYLAAVKKAAGSQRIDWWRGGRQGERPGQKENSPLLDLAKHLSKQPWIQTVNAVETTAVPVIKAVAGFKEAGADIRLDISFDTPSHRGLATCMFVKGLIAEYPLLSPLTLVLKQFLVMKGLNDPYKGGLSSYGLVLMITSVLQRRRWRIGQQAKKAALLAELAASAGTPEVQRRVLQRAASRGTVAHLGLEERNKQKPPVLDGNRLARRLEAALGAFSGTTPETAMLSLALLEFFEIYGRAFQPRRHAISISSAWTGKNLTGEFLPTQHYPR